MNLAPIPKTRSYGSLRGIFASVISALILVLPSPLILLAQPPDPAQPDVAEPSLAPPDQNHEGPSIKLRGSVWRMKAGIVFLRTSIGMLTLSSKTGLRDLRGSHEVIFWVNGDTSVVEIRQKGSAALMHRYISGDLQYSSPEKNAITLWTPEGEQTFAVAAYQTRLSSLDEQSPITVEVDEAGKVIGLHNLEFDLQISQAPHESSDAHLVLKGTISKLKSNFVFFKTPLGVITVSSKTGLRNAKVGQDMSLWVHGSSLVVDLYQKGASTPTRRFLTGRLVYSSEDKKTITLWTPEGEQGFPTERGRAALSPLREGMPITVEINHQGTVVDIRALS